MSRRLVRRAVNAVLPLSLQWKLSGLRGRVVRIARGADDEVLASMRAYLVGKTPEEIHAAARSQAEQAARLAAVKGFLPKLARARYRTRYEIVGRENLKEALALNRGVILLASHLGHARCIMAILQAHGFDAALVVSKLLRTMEFEARVTRWLEQRTLFRKGFERIVGVDAFEKGCIPAQLDVRPILKGLAANRIMVVLGDGDKAADLQRLPFLGGFYPFPKGFMKIAKEMGAPVLPCLAIDGTGSNWVSLHIAPPLDVDPDASVEERVAVYARLLERQVREAPHLWYRWIDMRSLEGVDGAPAGEWVDRWNRGNRARPPSGVP